MGHRGYKGTSKKVDMSKKIIQLGAGLAGGVIANEATSFLEKQSWLGPMAPHASAMTAIFGGLTFLFVPQNSDMNTAFAHAGYGAFIAGGTEQAETLIGMAKGALGFTPQQLGLGKSKSMGFTSQTLPPGARAAGVYINGTPVR